MPTIKVLPHPQRCPQGALFEAKPGDNLIELLLAHDIEIEHACERSCACRALSQSMSSRARPSASCCLAWSASRSSRSRAPGSLGAGTCAGARVLAARSCAWSSSSRRLQCSW